MRIWARWVSAAAGLRIRVHGEEHIARDHGVLYVANHVSWFDVIALAAVIPRYTFVAKAELRKLPFFGFGAQAAGMVFLDRDNQRQAFASYKSAATELERGRSIVVCPEGTRGRDYHLRPFKKGPFVLAIAAQAPIVPVIVHGQLEVMRRDSWRIRPGVVNIHFLPPIPTIGRTYDDRAELMTIVWQEMAVAMRQLYGVGTTEQPIARERERSA
jgi:1-acyl-sn-glycerol-3-phosphate acyltransferase